MIGLEGPTRMDENGHISIQREAFGEFRVQINFMVLVPTNLVHIALGSGTYT